MTRLRWIAAVSVASAGAAMTGYALLGPRPAPVPPPISLGEPATFRVVPPGDGPPSAGGLPPAGRCAPRAAARPGAPTPALSFSPPVQVAIPALCVRASVIALGENPDGTARVPPLSRPRLTSWFDDGPAPGQVGPAVLYGHVDTAAAGPAVFYGLGDLVPGDQVDITRADHRVAVFSVYWVAEYPKDAFPTMTVYGDTAGPELRLITCGGAFDQRTGSYPDNIVVYARLTTA